MSITYTPTTNFGAKDTLPANDPAKVIKGADFSTEFTAIQGAFSLAAPASGPTFTGTATFVDATVTGDLAATLTTAAQPNITSVGKLTGFESTGIDDNATSTAITIDASENVGIGGEPKEKLHVITATNGLGAVADDSADELVLENTGDVGMTLLSPNTATQTIAFGDPENRKVGWIEYDHTTNAATFGTGNAPRMTIDSTGRLGIGTDAPSASLDVESEIHVNDPASANPLRLKQTGANAEVVNVAAGDIEIGLANDGDIHFVNGVAKNKRMTIDNTGQVGIGTDAPNSKVDITHAQSEGSYAHLEINGQNSNENTQIALIGAGTGVHKIVHNKDLLFGTASNPADTTSTVTDNVTFAANGRVGIGTDFPASILDVTGDSPAIKINASDNDKPRIELARDASVNNWRIVNEAAVFKTQVGDDSTSWLETYRVTSGYNHYWNTDAMALTSSGNLGIGQTSPTDLLTVGGSPYAINQTERVGVVIGDTTGSHVRAGFGIKTNSAGTSRLSIETATGTAGAVIEVMTATSNGHVALPGYDTGSMTLDVGTEGTSINSILSLNQQQGKVTIEAGGTLTNTDDTLGGNFEFVTTEAFGSTATAMTVKGTGALNLEPRASAPAAPAAGDLYFDSSTNKLRCYDGTTWQNCF